MVGRYCNGSFIEVFTEKQWENIMYKCLCSCVTEKQINELRSLGLPEADIRDKLKIGKDCGTCVKGEKNDHKRKESKSKEE